MPPILDQPNHHIRGIELLLALACLKNSPLPQQPCSNIGCNLELLARGFPKSRRFTNGQEDPLHGLGVRTDET